MGSPLIDAVFGILVVLALVAANGFFVASEFSLVAVRRSRVQQLAATGRPNATALKRAVDHLDANLAATQLGITISSLTLGWVGEPALAHLIEPALLLLPAPMAEAGSHAIAVVIAFIIITTLHIVLGELAPKSLALQRSEGTALAIVRLLALFRILLWPAIVTLNGLGNWILRQVGLRPGGGEESLHSAEELKMLIAASQEAGLLQAGQRDVVTRVLDMGNRRISTIMTPRIEVDWIDTEWTKRKILKTIRDCTHEQLLVGTGTIDAPLGMVLKKDLLDQVLEGEDPDPMKVIRTPLALPETLSVFRALDRFKRAPVRLAMVLDEFGVLQGIVTQTNLLEAIAGELPEAEGELPGVVQQDDGSFEIDGMVPAAEAFERLGFSTAPKGDFDTIAGFALSRLEHLPEAGEHFEYEGWRFEITHLDGRRIDRMTARRTAGQ
jgi:CBS domain containing-hemolysin-like protein